MNVRAARGAIVVPADEPATLHEATAKLLGAHPRTQRDRARRPDQHPVHGHRGPVERLPRGGRAAHGDGRHPPAVCPRDPGRRVDAGRSCGSCSTSTPSSACARSPTSTSTGRRRCGTISMAPPDRAPSLRRVAVIGTGLIGTSIAMAAAPSGRSRRPGGTETRPCWRPPPRPRVSPPRARWTRRSAAPTWSWWPRRSPPCPRCVVAALAAAPIGDRHRRRERQDPRDRRGPASASAVHVSRFVPGHPMGGSERSGPDHASASVVDGIVWVLTPDARDRPGRRRTARRLWVDAIGARPVVHGTRPPRPAGRDREPPPAGGLDHAHGTRGRPRGG